jgi:uncharacterized integral membrane protein (TIGR00698 family)
MADKPKNPLLAKEDWWTVWFGMVILLVATALGILHLQDALPKYKVPKLGTWVSNPLDTFSRTKKVSIDIHKGDKEGVETLTLAEMVEAINAKSGSAKAEATLESTAEGVVLRVSSLRDGTSETIKFKALLENGDVDLKMSAKDKDASGLGAREYVSDPLPSEDAIVARGPAKIQVTGQRMGSIVPAMIISLVLVGILTAFGVRVMGDSAGKYAFGFGVVALLAILSYLVANQTQVKTYGLGYAFWALGFGLLISNTIGTPEWLKPGVRTEMYIKTGLVLLGAEILFSKILALGPPGLLVAWVVTPTVIIFMYLFGVKILKLSSKALVMIIAAATSVCGVSAAIAAAGASRAKKEELTLAVGMTLIFTVLMMIFMPILIHAVGMDKVVGAAWMGGTIDSTGAVVAAGAFLGPKAETVAAVVKMVQNVLIGVVGFGIAVFWVTSVERDPNGPRPNAMEIWVRFPKFIVGFVAASVLFSFVLSPFFGSTFGTAGAGTTMSQGVDIVSANVIKTVTNPLRGWFFCLAFVAIGLESNFRELASQMEGGKPMLLYVIGQSFNLILTLFMAWIAFQILFPGAI